MGIIEWLKKPSAIGEVMQGRVRDALDAQKKMDNCKSRLAELKRNCPNFEPREDAR